MQSGSKDAWTTRHQWDAGPMQGDVGYASLPAELRLFETELVVDANSLFSAASAVVVRELAEKTRGVLLCWLRELIDLCLLRFSAGAAHAI